MKFKQLIMLLLSVMLFITASASFVENEVSQEQGDQIFEYASSYDLAQVTPLDTYCLCPITAVAEIASCKTIMNYTCDDVVQLRSALGSKPNVNTYRRARDGITHGTSRMESVSVAICTV